MSRVMSEVVKYEDAARDFKKGDGFVPLLYDSPQHSLKAAGMLDLVLKIRAIFSAHRSQMDSVAARRATEAEFPTAGAKGYFPKLFNELTKDDAPMDAILKMLRVRECIERGSLSEREGDELAVRIAAAAKT